MAHLAAKQWQLSKVESITTFENWRQSLLETLSQEPIFLPFLVPGLQWQKRTAAAPTRGLQHDGEDVPEQERSTAHQKVVQLELMLGQIAYFCPIIARFSITKTAKSLDDIWHLIRHHFGFPDPTEPSEQPNDLEYDTESDTEVDEQPYIATPPLQAPVHPRTCSTVSTDHSPPDYFTRPPNQIAAPPCHVACPPNKAVPPSGDTPMTSRGLNDDIDPDDNTLTSYGPKDDNTLTSRSPKDDITCPPIKTAPPPEDITSCPSNQTAQSRRPKPLAPNLPRDSDDSSVLPSGPLAPDTSHGTDDTLVPSYAPNPRASRKPPDWPSGTDDARVPSVAPKPRPCRKPPDPPSGTDGMHALRRPNQATQPLAWLISDQD